MPKVILKEIPCEIVEFPMPHLNKDILEEYRAYAKTIKRDGPKSIKEEPLYPSEQELIAELNRSPTIKERIKDYLVDRGIYYKYFFKWQAFKRSVKMQVEHLIHKYFHNDECGCS